MLLFVEVVAGKASPAETRAAILAHADHSRNAPQPSELLAIIRLQRPRPTDAEKVSAGEATTRADNQRLALAGCDIRWHRREGSAPEMFILGGPGEKRGCAYSGRVIAPMFKHATDDKPGEWFAGRDDARLLAENYAEHGSPFRMNGNVVVAVDADGVAWTHPDDTGEVE